MDACKAAATHASQALIQPSSSGRTAGFPPAAEDAGSACTILLSLWGLGHALTSLLPNPLPQLRRRVPGQVARLRGGGQVSGEAGGSLNAPPSLPSPHSTSRWALPTRTQPGRSSGAGPRPPTGCSCADNGTAAAHPRRCLNPSIFFAGSEPIGLEHWSTGQHQMPPSGRPSPKAFTPRTGHAGAGCRTHQHSLRCPASPSQPCALPAGGHRAWGMLVADTVRPWDHTPRPPGPAGDLSSINRAAIVDLIKEADLLGSMRHPNIVWVRTPCCAPPLPRTLHGPARHR